MVISAACLTSGLDTNMMCLVNKRLSPVAACAKNGSYYQVARGCVCMHAGRGLLLKIADCINGKSQQQEGSRRAAKGWKRAGRINSLRVYDSLK